MNACGDTIEIEKVVFEHKQTRKTDIFTPSNKGIVKFYIFLSLCGRAGCFSLHLDQQKTHLTCSIRISNFLNGYPYAATPVRMYPAVDLARPWRRPFSLCRIPDREKYPHPSTASSSPEQFLSTFQYIRHPDLSTAARGECSPSYSHVPGNRNNGFSWIFLAGYAGEIGG